MRVALKREESPCSFSVIWHVLSNGADKVSEGVINALPAMMDCPRPAFSTWCGTAWVSVPAAVDFQHSTQLWHCGTGWAGYAALSPERKKKRINWMVTCGQWNVERTSQPCSPPGTSAWLTRRFASSRTSRGGSGTAAETSRSSAWCWCHVAPDLAPPNLCGMHHTQPWECLNVYKPYQKKNTISSNYLK